MTRIGDAADLVVARRQSDVAAGIAIATARGRVIGETGTCARCFADGMGPGGNGNRSGGPSVALVGAASRRRPVDLQVKFTCVAGRVGDLVDRQSGLARVG